jgi:hypothetical protein
VLQGFNEMIQPASNSYSSATTGTYGGVARPTAFSGDAPSTGNTWWSPKYKTWTSPREINLESDMRNLYNTISDNIAPPNLIVTTQTLYELYEEYASDRSQIVKGTDTGLANLGFDQLYFKGKPLIWSPNMTTDNILMLNTDYVELVYDPTLWFQLGDWVSEIGTERRQASILCAGNLISDQLRRHGRLHP